MNQPAAVEALQFIYDLTYKDKVAPTPQEWAPFGAGSWAGRQAKDVGMLMSGNWELAMITKLKNRDNYGLTFLPVGKTGSPVGLDHSEALGIFAQTKHKEESWEVFKWMVGKEAQLKRTKAGFAGAPAIKSLAKDLKEDPYFWVPDNEEYFWESAKYVHALPSFVKYGEWFTVFNKHLELIRDNKMSPKAAMDAVAAETAKLLAEK